MIKKWHPMLAAHEQPTGHWTMLDSRDHAYGTIVVSGSGYLATDATGESVGRFRTLKEATERVHRKWIASFGAGGSRAAGSRGGAAVQPELYDPDPDADTWESTAPKASLAARFGTAVAG
ncbi:hypothetical protein [Naasia lichenicola]|uniref:Uncharacterized protein n=1 Tax=Naasia lichenicola TaxID=2565933 RepID=A0A4S4FTD6_9MICO|nr:hypothetical protein [Naasia lichenicola]THG33202.1 hypothetical protein E6C64_02275 [Naasia lichenicola]